MLNQLLNTLALVRSLAIRNVCTIARDTPRQCPLRCTGPSLRFAGRTASSTLRVWQWVVRVVLHYEACMEKNPRGALVVLAYQGRGLSASNSGPVLKHYGGAIATSNRYQPTQLPTPMRANGVSSHACWYRHPNKHSHSKERAQEFCWFSSTFVTLPWKYPEPTCPSLRHLGTDIPRTITPVNHKLESCLPHHAPVVAYSHCCRPVPWSFHISARLVV